MLRTTLRLFASTSKPMIKPKYQHIINPPTPLAPQLASVYNRINITQPKLTSNLNSPAYTAKETDFLNCLDEHFELPPKTP